MNPKELIDKFQKQESEFSGSSFLAPAVPGGAVRVRLAGLVYTFRVRVREPGWFLFRSDDLKTARLVGTPSSKQIREYMGRLPALTVVLLEFFDGIRFGLQYSSGSKGLTIQGPVPVHLSEKSDVFDLVSCRFDGANVWMDRKVNRSDPQRAADLRGGLSRMVHPDDLRVLGASDVDRLAYQGLYRRHRPSQLHDQDADDWTRLSRSLAASGASLENFSSRAGEQFHVSFMYDGQRHSATVNRSNFTVTSAGFCLADRDTDFDLTSLVGVLRERDRRW